jgi:cytochrome c553
MPASTMNKVHSLLIAAVAVAAPIGLAQAQDAQAGEKKAAMCIGCHGIPGYQASFPEIHKVPMISGQGAKYIVSALTAYKKGERKHPTMKATATPMSDQDMADLGAFYAAQAAPAPAQPLPAPDPAVAELLKKGNCASCHGENYAKPIDPSYPKLAGQHADYLYVALKAYQTENNRQVGRANAIMGGIAKQFTPRELKLLANYIGSLPSELQTLAQSRWR